MKKISSFDNIASDYPDYLHDESRVTASNAQHLVWPENENDVIDSILFAQKENMPITISAARTGIVAAAVPLCGGMILSMEKMNKMTPPQFDEQKNEWFMLVQPGVLLQDIQSYLHSNSENLFYPPDPTEMTAAIGGTVATNASGARTYKYGATRNYIRELRVVLSDGNVLNIKRGKHIADENNEINLTAGGKTYKIPVPNYSMPKTKNCAGYFANKNTDLIDLFIGSEGTLGVITEIEIKLLKNEKERLSLLSFFSSEQKAFDFVNSIRDDEKLDVEAIEFFGKNALALLHERHKAGQSDLQDFPKCDAAIFTEFLFDENELDDLYERLEDKLNAAGTTTDASWAAMDFAETENLKKFRHAIPETINQIIGERKKHFRKLHKIATDLAVPNENFNTIFNFYREQLDSVGLQYAIFGHIGNNHLHVNIMPRDENEITLAKEFYKTFAEKAVELGGTVSAEHGIGKLKKDFLKLMYGDRGIEQMKLTKQSLDPNNIFGVGNLF